MSNMPNSYILSTAFLSYSHADQAAAQNLLADLRGIGADIWMDAHLVPGTPDWDQAIRTHLSDAFAVILLVSPETRLSPYIEVEVTLANCPIIPFWIRGDQWVDCIPASLIRTQYIDARGDVYQDGLLKLKEALGVLAESRFPPFGILRGYITNPNYNYVALPGNQLAGFRHDAFPTMRQVLDQLYVVYLTDEFLPFTYGQDWVLELQSERDWDNARPHLAHVLLPWEGLHHVNLRRPAIGYAGAWQEVSMSGVYPSKGSFRKTNVLQVCAMPSVMFGFATNDPVAIRDFTEFFDHISSAKGISYLLIPLLAEMVRNGEARRVAEQNASIAIVDPEEVDPSQYAFTMLATVDVTQLPHPGANEVAIPNGWSFRDKEMHALNLAHLAAIDGKAIVFESRRQAGYFSFSDALFTLAQSQST